MIANTYVVKPFGISEVKVIALKGEPGGPTQEQVNAAVEEYMDDHPESQIPDGSVSMSKLSSDVAENVSDVPNKANSTGSYPDLIAGTAENLLSSSYKTNRTPYLLRRTPYGARERGSIVGGSIVWNQLQKATDTTETVSGVTFTNNGDGTWTANGTATAQARKTLANSQSVTGHVVLIIGSPSGGSTTTYCLLDNLQSDGNKYDSGNGRIYRVTNSNGRVGVKIQIGNGYTANNIVFRPQVFDLTLMFGSSIADYILSIETATAGAGVTLAKAWAGITADYYPYDAGNIKSVTGLTAHRMTGKNLVDISRFAELYPNNCTYDGNTLHVSRAFIGLYSTGLPVNIPAGTTMVNATITEGTATNVRVRLVLEDGAVLDIFGNQLPYKSTTKIVAVCFNWSESGSFDVSNFQIEYGENATTYEPYTVYEYPLDSSLTLRGLPKLDGDSIYYDGDIYPPSGEVERRHKILHIDDSYQWYKDYDSGGYNRYYFDDDSIKRYTSYEGMMLNSKGYETATGHYFVGAASNIAITLYVGGTNVGKNWFYIGFKTSLGISTVDALKEWLAANSFDVVVEIATPTTEQAEPYTELQICDPAGTEEWVGASMPVGHDTKYYADLKGKIEGIPDAPSASGTYVLKAMVSSSGVTYSWVAG